MDGSIYVNTNESLQVSITSSVGGNVPPGTGFSGVTVNIDMRMLTVNDGLQYLTFMFVPSNDSSTETFQIKLPEGLLLNVSAYTAGVVVQLANGLPVDPMLGQTWVSLSIVAPVEPNHHLATYLTQGYVTNVERVCYPPQQTISYEDGYPFFRFGQIIPGRGYLGYAIPQNSVNEITGVSFSITTSAAGSTRSVFLAVESSLGTSTTRRNLVIPMGAQGPSITNQIYWAWQGSPVETVTSIGSFAPLPERLRLKNGEYFYAAMTSQDAGDSIGNFFLWGNEWLVP